MTQHPIKHNQPLDILAGLLSYVVPGLGQIMQGRVSKGLFFMVTLLSLFHVGLAMGNWKNVYIAVDPPVANVNVSKSLMQYLLDRNLYYYGQFWIGAAAWPAIYQYRLNDPFGDQPRTFWQNYQRGPRTSKDFDQHNVEVRIAANKELDLGLIYTTVAGLLNLLVIYDAMAGPAFTESDPTKKPPEE